MLWSLNALVIVRLWSVVFSVQSSEGVSVPKIPEQAGVEVLIRISGGTVILIDIFWTKFYGLNLI